MIARIWRGWTTPANADAYESLLRDEVFPWILDKRIDGFQGIDLLRRESGDEVEFVTLTGDTFSVVTVPADAVRAVNPREIAHARVVTA